MPFIIAIYYYFIAPLLRAPLFHYYATLLIDISLFFHAFLHWHYADFHYCAISLFHCISFIAYIYFSSRHASSLSLQFLFRFRFIFWRHYRAGYHYHYFACHFRHWLLPFCYAFYYCLVTACLLPSLLSASTAPLLSLAVSLLMPAAIAMLPLLLAFITGFSSRYYIIILHLLPSFCFHSFSPLFEPFLSAISPLCLFSLSFSLFILFLYYFLRCFHYFIFLLPAIFFNIALFQFSFLCLLLLSSSMNILDYFH